MGSGSKGRAYASFAAGPFVVVAIVLTLNLWGDSGPSDRGGEVSYARGDDQWIPGSGKIPCVAGGLKLKSAGELAQNLRSTPYLPDHPLANASNMKEAWMCTPYSADVLFETGIRMTLSPTEDPDLAGDWTREVAGDPAHHRPAVVKGRTAKLFDFDGDPLVNEGGSLAWLLEDEIPKAAEPEAGIPQATRLDLLLVVSSETHSLETLLAVAESFRPY